MDSQEKIVRAAEEVFADLGYDGATVKAICERAGVNIASVNYYYRSKRELYLTVVKTLYGRVEPKAREIMTMDVSDVSLGSWRRVVADLVRIIGFDENASLDVQRFDNIIFRELNTPSEVFEEIYALCLKPVADHVETIFKRFFPTMDARERFLWINTLVGQLCFVKNARGFISKWRGEEFFDGGNYAGFQKHVAETLVQGLSDKIMDSASAE